MLRQWWMSVDNYIDNKNPVTGEGKPIVLIRQYYECIKVGLSNTAVTPVRLLWIYCSLALSHRCIGQGGLSLFCCIQNCVIFNNTHLYVGYVDDLSNTVVTPVCLK